MDGTGALKRRASCGTGRMHSSAVQAVGRDGGWAGREGMARTVDWLAGRTGALKRRAGCGTGRMHSSAVQAAGRDGGWAGREGMAGAVDWLAGRTGALKRRAGCGTGLVGRKGWKDGRRTGRHRADP